MLKLKVSYEHPEELERLIERLGADVKRMKVSKNQKMERFKKAYIELKERNL